MTLAAGSVAARHGMVELATLARAAPSSTLDAGYVCGDRPGPTSTSTVSVLRLAPWLTRVGHPNSGAQP